MKHLFYQNFWWWGFFSFLFSSPPVLHICYSDIFNLYEKCGNSVVYSGPEVAVYFTVSNYFGYDFHSVCADDMMKETYFVCHLLCNRPLHKYL